MQLLSEAYRQRRARKSGNDADGTRTAIYFKKQRAPKRREGEQNTISNSERTSGKHRKTCSPALSIKKKWSSSKNT